VSDLRSAVAGRADWPTVSVIMPVRNEATHLEHAVESILAQDYPLPFDICLAVAPSDDDTQAVAATLARRHDRVSVVANPAGITPAGLNTAVAATSGEVIVRVDGHAALSPGYIRSAVETMRRTGAVNVGGRQNALGEGDFERAVAAAMTSYIGTGGARFHVGGEAGPVDTVYLGVFDRTAGDLAGWFDETLIRNQDYELNIRLRELGGTIWFDPELSVTYRPRGTIGKLARQYYEYGYWKNAVVRIHPESLKLRQAIPAVSTVVLAVSVIAGTRRPGWLAVPAAYATVVAGAAVGAGTRDVPARRIAMAVLVMQQAWGIGFLAGAADALRRRVDGRAS
jgi:succinoglycan biosynthesis protein ExoA